MKNPTGNGGERVVITGLGAITPLGLSVETTWQGLVEGRSGVTPITAFDASMSAVRIAASVKDFDPTRYMAPQRSAAGFPPSSNMPWLQSQRRLGSPGSTSAARTRPGSAWRSAAPWEASA